MITRNAFIRRFALPLFTCLTCALGASPLLGGLISAQVAPAAQEASHPTSNVRPDPVRVGPVFNAAAASALTPNDLVTYDFGFTGSAATSSTGGAILNLSVHGGGTGGETTLASSSVGSGVAYNGNSQGVEFVGIAPANASSGALVYYFDHRTVGSTGYYDLVQLNPTTLVRTVVSDGSNASLGTIPLDISCMCWDSATSTILYFDFRSSVASATSGFYRVDPATGLRTAVSLDGGSPGSGVTVYAVTYMSTDPYGNLFYLDSTGLNSQGSANQVYTSVFELPVSAAGSTTYGARTTISSNTVGKGGSAAYIDLTSVAVDPSASVTLNNGLPTSETLVVVDTGDSQTDSAVYRVASNGGTRTVLTDYAVNANNASSPFDFPEGGVADTTGRVYYNELHNGSNAILTAIPAGSSSTTYLANANNLSLDDNNLTLVPAPVPTLATGTASNVLGTTATLASTVNSDGGTTNAGILSRGIVYALTSANTVPKIGGAGVTRAANLQATSAPVAQGSNEGAFSVALTGLTLGTSYTFSAYAQDDAGYGYSTPVAFTTATAPVLSTTAATSITGISATLGGNITSAGGGNATITTRGIVYSSTNTSPIIGATGVTNIADASATTGTYTDGTGNNLADGTTYYFRAYAVNQVVTNYGSVLSFTTIAPPTANSQSVSVAFNTAKAITLTGTDPNNPAQTLTYAIATNPTHGTISSFNNGSGAITYTPNANYQGADSFTFTATNTSGLTSAAATVSIIVAPGTPTATAQSVAVGQGIATPVILSGTDPDSPALALTYTVITAPAHGTLSGTAPNLTYTPTSGYTGSDSFTFTVTNGVNTSAAATVSLTVEGQPYMTGFSPASGPVGTTVTITGANLQGSSGVVFFRNLGASSFTVVSSTQITAVVPAGAKTGAITVNAPAGNNTTNTKFTVTQ